MPSRTRRGTPDTRHPRRHGPSGRYHCAGKDSFFGDHHLNVSNAMLPNESSQSPQHFAISCYIRFEIRAQHQTHMHRPRRHLGQRIFTTSETFMIGTVPYRDIAVASGVTTILSCRRGHDIAHRNGAFQYITHPCTLVIFVSSRVFAPIVLVNKWR